MQATGTSTSGFVVACEWEILNSFSLSRKILLGADGAVPPANEILPVPYSGQECREGGAVAGAGVSF